MKKIFLPFVVFMSALVSTDYFPLFGAESISFTPPQIPCEKFVEEYHKLGRSYRRLVDDDVKYDCNCDFFKWGTRNYSGREFLDGVPLVKYYGKNEKNPCTILQYTLAMYGKYLKGESSKEEFLRLADYCIGMMSEDGSFRYGFAYRYYVAPKEYYNKPGWTSSMTNGHMLQVMSRAYRLTKDEKYIKAGNLALDFLNTPIEEGGVKTTLKELSPDLASYVIYEEYPCTPATYTLNGYMFTLIGIYDWSCLDETEKKQDAKKMFRGGIETLKVILPAYDLGGFTCYDLSYLTWKRKMPHVGVGYHAIHVAFCKIFFDITGEEEFNFYFKKWKNYVEKDRTEE